jgi:hypothetical protein
MISGRNMEREELIINIDDVCRLDRKFMVQMIDDHSFIERSSITCYT